MSDAPIELPESIKPLVLSVGAKVTSAELSNYATLRTIEDRSFKIRTLVNAWEHQHTEERDLRKTYGRWILVGLLAQMISVNLAFYLIGFGVMKVEVWMANSFIMAVFGEIAAMSFFVIKHLFPKVESELLEHLE